MSMDLRFWSRFSLSNRGSSGVVKGHGADGGGKFDIDGKYTVNYPQNKFDLTFDKNHWDEGVTRFAIQYKATIPFNSRQMSGIYSVSGNYGGEFKMNHIIGNEKLKQIL